MKKIIASILGLSLVFTAAIAVSAAPTVSGEVVYKANFENKIPLNENLFEGKVNFTGQLDNKTDYKLSLKGTNTANDVTIDEASITHKHDLATIQAGYFGYNPSVMDMLDGAAKEMAEMKAPFAVKVAPNLGENVKVAVGVQPRNANGFEDWSYQVEANYVMDTVSFGLNYQNVRQGDAAIVWEASFQPTESLKVYGEMGESVTDNEDVLMIGALYTTEKLSLRGEYDMENDNNWAAKAGYKFTSNISGEFDTNKAEEHQARLKYTF